MMKSVNKYLHIFTLQWHHNEHDGISNHQPHDCILNRLFRRRSKKISKLRVTGLCAGNSLVTAQRASKAENVSIWWRHHDKTIQHVIQCHKTIDTSIWITSKWIRWKQRTNGILMEWEKILEGVNSCWGENICTCRPLVVFLVHFLHLFCGIAGLFMTLASICLITWSNISLMIWCNIYLDTAHFLQHE